MTDSAQQAIACIAESMQCTWAAPVQSTLRDGKLVGLTLRGKIGKAGRAAVLALEHLQVLDIGQLTGINNKWLAQLGQLPALRLLDAWYTCLGDVGAAGLAASTTLQALDVRKTRIGDAGLTALAGSPSLRHLQCTAGKTVPDAGLRGLAEAPRLESLAVVRPPFTYQSSWLQPETLSALARLPLTALSLYGVLDTGAGLDALLACPDLRALGLGSNYHGGRRHWNQTLGQFDAIEHLDLSDCRFRNETELECLRDMSRLRVVHAYGTSFAVDAPGDLRVPQVTHVVARADASWWASTVFPNAVLAAAVPDPCPLGVEGKLRLPLDLRPLLSP